MANKTKMVPNPGRNVFIVEDHPVFREGLVQILNGEGDLTVCGFAENATAAMQAVDRLKPDLVLVDIGLPGKSGLELIKDLRQVNQTVKLLAVSMHDEALYADRVLRAGGDGYVMKQQDPQEIVHAIRDVLNGHIYVSEEVMASASHIPHKRTAEPDKQPLAELSDEDLELLELLGQGKSEGEIARRLHLNVAKVETQCVRMRRKLKLKTANALVRYAVCWVETP